MKQESVFERAAQSLSSLPGLGPKSARRVLLHLLSKKEKVFFPLLQSLQETFETVRSCVECGNFSTGDLCSICEDSSRNNGILCVIEQVSDLWALEKTRIVEGKYHILGGTLSALEGRNPSDLRIESLIRRIQSENISEVVFALSPKLEAQTTMFYIGDLLKSYPLKLSVLARGVPLGAEIDYLDEGTLMTAFQYRSPL